MRLRITLEDESYEVCVEVLPEMEAEPQDEAMLASLPDAVLRPPRGADLRDQDRVCRSPIAGLVMSVGARPRQWVRRNDPVLVIEAMKMQNTIYAPMEGLLEEIHVAPGEAVKSGQPLFRMS